MSFASDYENNILAFISQTADSERFGAITINSVDMKLYDNDGNQVQSITIDDGNGSTNSAFEKHASIALVLSCVFFLFA